MGDDEVMTREEIIALATRANKARRAGFSDAEVSEMLEKEYGFTRKELFEALKAQPKEVAPKALSTKELISLMDQGATFGLGGPGGERVSELKDMGYGKEINAMRGLGAAGSALTLGGLASTIGILRSTGAGIAPQLMRSGQVRKALQEISPSVAGAAGRLKDHAGNALKLGARAIRWGYRRPLHVGAGLYGADKIADLLRDD